MVSPFTKNEHKKTSTLHHAMLLISTTTGRTEIWFLEKKMWSGFHFGKKLMGITIWKMKFLPEFHFGKWSFSRNFLEGECSPCLVLSVSDMAEHCKHLPQIASQHSDLAPGTEVYTNTTFTRTKNSFCKDRGFSTSARADWYNHTTHLNNYISVIVLLF